MLLPNYEELVAKGVSPKLAEIFATAQPPGTGVTDKSFFEGRLNGHAVPDKFKALDYALAKKAGISTSGKLYHSGIADSRGPQDPEAWVSGLDDLKRVIKKRNLTTTGIVNHKGVETPPKPDVPLSDKIVNRIIAQETKKDPGLKSKPKQELKEMVIAKHARKK